MDFFDLLVGKIGTLCGPVRSSALSSPARIGGCRFEPWLETHFYHLSSLARSYFLVFSFMTPLFGSRNIFRPCCNMDSAEMSKFLLISSFV